MASFDVKGGKLARSESSLTDGEENGDENVNIDQHFSKAELAVMSAYEKNRYVSLKKNYLELVRIGVNPEVPLFMQKPRRKRARPKSLSSSGSDGEWRPPTRNRDLVRTQSRKSTKTVRYADHSSVSEDSETDESETDESEIDESDTDEIGTYDEVVRPAGRPSRLGRLAAAAAAAGTTSPLSSAAEPVPRDEIGTTESSSELSPACSGLQSEESDSSSEPRPIHVGRQNEAEAGITSGSAGTVCTSANRAARNIFGKPPAGALAMSGVRLVRDPPVVHRSELETAAAVRAQLVEANSGGKPYACGQCGLGFTKPLHLRIHLRVHTGEKPHGCRQCGRRFAQVSNLRVHERSHSGEKPYACGQCEKRFSRVASLHVHSRAHTGERPYECKQCGRKFSQLSALRGHLKTHTGERSYGCEQCGQRFTQLGNLKRHLQGRCVGREPMQRRRQAPVDPETSPASGLPVAAEEKPVEEDTPASPRARRSGGRGRSNADAAVAQTSLPSGSRTRRQAAGRRVTC